MAKTRVKKIKAKIMKGIILAGGRGTRLLPLTKITNKHLLPIFDRAMIDYPLQTLLSAGITNILIVSGREHAGDFIEYLGSGKDRDATFTYKVQDAAGGIAQALLLAEDFVDGDNMTVILGDNIFGENFKKKITKFKKGATVFLKEVADPERFGVATLKGNKVVKIVEKPKKPESNMVTTGVYQYDNSVFDIIRKLKPSDRGELEQTDVNNAFIKKGLMNAEMVDEFWSDAGTFDSLARTVNWVIERRNK